LTKQFGDCKSGISLFEHEKAKEEREQRGVVMEKKYVSKVVGCRDIK